MEPSPHPRAVLGLRKANYPHLLGRGQTICVGLSTHPALFLNPNPSLAVLQGAVQELDQAQQATATRLKGATQARNLKAAALITNLEMALAYVQSLVDSNPLQGALLITAAGMLIAQTRSYTKPVLQATQAMPSAPVRLVANVGVVSAGARGRIVFTWQLTSDGGKTWIDAPPTPHGRTEIPGLTPLSTYGFRVSATSAKGAGPWSQVVTLLVH